MTPSTLTTFANYVLQNRALHEEEKRPKGGLTRLQFFFIVLICSFAYYIVPSYFFPYISSISILCLFFKNSITMQQIGSGLKGLGVLSFALDWNTVAGFLGNPLVTPAFAVFNLMAGFAAMVYVITPIAYWTNSFNAKKYPMFSSHVFDDKGLPFNTTRILDPRTFSINMEEYDSYSRINLGVMFAFTYGMGFAGLTAAISHVALHNGRYICLEEHKFFHFKNICTRLFGTIYCVPKISSSGNLRS